MSSFTLEVMPGGGESDHEKAIEALIVEMSSSEDNPYIERCKPFSDFCDWAGMYDVMEAYSSRHPGILFIVEEENDETGICRHAFKEGHGDYLKRWILFESPMFASVTPEEELLNRIERMESDLKILFRILDYTETKESGVEWHPTSIQSCRAMHLAELGPALDRLREAVRWGCDGS